MADDIPRSLAETKVRQAKPRDADYKLADGGGLFLLVKTTGARLWRYKFRLNGKEGLHSLGNYPDLTLAAARDAHRDARRLVAAGISPVQARREDRRKAEQAAYQAKAGAFEVVMAEWSARHEQRLRPLTIRQRGREIRKYLLPAFRGRQVETIRRSEIAVLLKRVEGHAPEVAKNLRNYLAAMYEHAADVGLVESSPVPPVRAMARRDRVPHPALAMDRLPAFLDRLDTSTAEPSTVAAMQLVILTACRKNEVCRARWDELDLDAAEWVIPATRMKAGRDHFVPLSRQAVAIFRQLRRATNGDLVFPNFRDPTKPMACRTLNAWLGRNGYEGETCHGFRSVFSTYFNGQGASADVIERCLAHAAADQTRGVYNRYEYRDERRVMLQEWADHLDICLHKLIKV